MSRLIRSKACPLNECSCSRIGDSVDLEPLFRRIVSFLSGSSLTSNLPSSLLGIENSNHNISLVVSSFLYRLNANIIDTYALELHVTSFYFSEIILSWISSNPLFRNLVKMFVSPMLDRQSVPTRLPSLFLAPDFLLKSDTYISPLAA